MDVVIHGHYLDHIIRFLQGIVCHLLTLQVIIKSRATCSYWRISCFSAHVVGYVARTV